MAEIKQKFETKNMVLCAIFAAICCVCSIITIPTGIVPVTLGTFGVMVTALNLGGKRGEISTAIFIVLGIIGIPVFSGINGGIGVIAGPTGGYIYSFLLMVPIIGLMSKKLNKSIKTISIAFLGCLLAILVCYAVGTAHFMIVMSTKGNAEGLFSALTMCVFPFIPFDILKAIIAILIAIRLKPICK
ncbi:MAG: biotin transporter BioY [Clostridia bacterium]|nr:biotin transporter BioY [Clostridia bacterium]